MSTLSSVVSKLVRASHGSAIPDSVPDDDLDRVVAELILKEAREKEAKYGKEGVRAYMPNGGLGDNNLPKPNKRFLTSIIKSVDDHNASVINQQLRAAEEAREEREETEKWERIRQDEEREERLENDRKERKRKEAEQAKDRMKRLLGGNLRRAETPGSRKGKETEKGGGGRERSEKEREVERQSSRPRLREEDGRDRYRRRDRDGYDSSPRPAKRRRDDSEPETSSAHRRRSDDDEPRQSGSGRHGHVASSSRSDRKRRHLASDEDEDVWRPSKRRSASRERGKRKEEDTTSRSRRTLPSVLPSSLPIHPALLSPPRSASDMDDQYAGPLSSPISKMDRYFEDSYDPRLDIQISKEGYIEPGQFEGWDQMLEVLKLRKEEKRLKEWERAAEEYASERSGKGKKKRSREEKEKEKEVEVHGRPIKELLEENRRKLAQVDKTEREQSVLNVVYKKRGEAREWDKGKVAF